LRRLLAWVDTVADHTGHRHVGRSSDAVATAGSSVALTVNALANNANGMSGAS
jgi:hypothetical protein